MQDRIPLLSSGRELNLAVITDKLRDLIISALEHCCAHPPKGMALPSSHSAKHGPSKSPWLNSPFPCAYHLSCFLLEFLGFPSGDPSVLPDWLTDSPLAAPGVPPGFQHPGKCLVPTLSTGFFTFALPFTSPALPVPAHPNPWGWAAELGVGISPSNTTIIWQLLIFYNCSGSFRNPISPPNYRISLLCVANLSLVPQILAIHLSH